MSKHRTAPCIDCVMMSVQYRAPGWAPGGHAQTLLAAISAARPAVSYRRETWDSPDGDFISTDFAQPEPDAADAPVLVLFHGLEGSAKSHYARSLMHQAVVRGWRALVVHFRGCGGQPNRRPRAYHSGDSDEADWILRAVSARWPAARLHAVGVSLGGNVLSKWLGERGEDAQRVQAAAVVSVPFDLVAGGASLARGFNREVYARYFLRSMRRKALDFDRRFPGLIDLGRVMASRDLYDFDDAFTAPLHGFRGVMHYWQAASAKPWLRSVAVPLLALNARNDPFVPAGSLPTPAITSRHVLLEQPEQGGHAGFIRAPWPGDLGFVPQRIFEFFERGT
jgi:predicted alpha/beta-fold hydrolase